MSEQNKTPDELRNSPPLKLKELKKCNGKHSIFSQYSLNFNEADRNFPGVTIRAVQVDMTIFGDPAQFFGPNYGNVQLKADL